jgi:hypothetical protein
MLYLPAPHASLEEREEEGGCGAEEGRWCKREREVHTRACVCAYQATCLCAHEYWPEYEACVSICTFVLVKHQESAAELRLYHPPASPCTLSDVTHTDTHTHTHT